ncbi:unnamed protein product [Arctia plantaginis]|uniref:Uncharacterized protein n=1 Tax=Arctia plantaginis TaxID=874455 RepID=A0A8S1BI36_ARCPL|nr:unnamed protein product [Arctia plantaginis]
MITGCRGDVNAKSPWWGSEEEDSRGASRAEFAAQESPQLPFRNTPSRPESTRTAQTVKGSGGGGLCLKLRDYDMERRIGPFDLPHPALRGGLAYLRASLGGGPGAAG